ncbi:NTPase [Candidatus Bathyarchaeota archaeon]|nr:NTPase [Candidatus Bathyarchaeota archaeon]
MQKALRKRVLVLTGAPGVGKTTVLSKTVDALKAKGVGVGGMVSREVREGNVRVGFEILDLTNSKHGWLSHVNQKNGPQVGKYHVNLDDLENIGAKAIIDAAEKCDVVAVDEVGPMELFSPKFKQAVQAALDSQKLVLAVVHAKARDPLLTEIRERGDLEVFTVTLANRSGLAEVLTNKALAALGEK